ELPELQVFRFGIGFECYLELSRAPVIHSSKHRKALGVGRTAGAVENVLRFGVGSDLSLEEQKFRSFYEFLQGLGAFLETAHRLLELLPHRLVDLRQYPRAIFVERQVSDQ